MSVAKIAGEARKKHGISVVALARKAQVDRVFLTNVLNPTKKPPRRKQGHAAASHDPRYRRIAEALELDPDEFCDQVMQEQTGYNTKRQKAQGEHAEVQGILYRLSQYALLGHGTSADRRHVQEQLLRIAKTLDPIEGKQS